MPTSAHYPLGERRGASGGNWFPPGRRGSEPQATHAPQSMSAPCVPLFPPSFGYFSWRNKKSTNALTNPGAPTWSCRISLPHRGPHALLKTLRCPPSAGAAPPHGMSHPAGTPFLIFLGGSEFRLRQGFAPQNACTAQSAAPSRDRAPTWSCRISLPHRGPHALLKTLRCPPSAGAAPRHGCWKFRSDT